MLCGIIAYSIKAKHVDINIIVENEWARTAAFGYRGTMRGSRGQEEQFTTGMGGKAQRQ